MATKTPKPSTRKPRREDVKSHIGELRKRVSLLEIIDSLPEPSKTAPRQLKLGFGR